MDKKLHGAAAHSHRYYTVEEGEYDNNKRAEGVLGLALLYGFGAVLGTLVGLAEVWTSRKKRKTK